MAQLQQLMNRVRGNLAYVLCEWLDGYASRRTTHVKVAAGTALAAHQALDIEAALASTDLPSQLAGVLGEFHAHEWQEILSIARSEIRMLEFDLCRPEWSHLRRSSGPSPQSRS